MSINPKFPSIEDLRLRAKNRMPRFAFEYLEGGANEEVNLRRNTAEIRDVQLLPEYLASHQPSSLKTELFGHVYDSPFGIAPVGLQGLMWPDSANILARAAHDNNIPFVLSTVTTSSIETVARITESQAWFQLYHPTDNALRDDLLDRLKKAGYKVLVLLCDTPVFGIRYMDVKNGLSMPPSMSVANFIQIFQRPEWAIKTLIHGQPEFKTLSRYIPKGTNMKKLGVFMNQTFDGRLNEDKISQIRDQWQGKLILKGVASKNDAGMAVKLGLDGIILSNHGGRQLDAGPSTISTLGPIARQYGGKIKVMIDSGLRSGIDVGRCLASGADFTFLGRGFMYGVAALGANGGDHTIGILNNQLRQLMEQLGCDSVADFPDYLKVE